MRGLCLRFTNPVGTGGVLDVCLCLGCCVGREWVGGLAWVWRGGVVLCLCELRVQIFYVEGRSRYLFIVFCRYLRTLGETSLQSCCTLWISTSYRVFVYGIYRKFRLLFVCGCRTWICLHITRFYEEERQPCRVSAWPVFQKKHGKSGPHFIGRVISTHCPDVCNRV